MKSEDRESLNKSYRELLAYGTTQPGVELPGVPHPYKLYWYFMGDIGRLGVCQRVDVTAETSTTDFSHSVNLKY